MTTPKIASDLILHCQAEFDPKPTTVEFIGMTDNEAKVDTEVRLKIEQPVKWRTCYF